MPNPYAKYVQQEPGVIPLGSPDPTQPYKGPAAQSNLVGQNLSNVHTQQQIAAQPIQQQGQVLNNQQTAQQIQFARSNAASDLANKFNGDQRVKAYREVLPQAVKAMAADTGKQGDLTVVYAWAKAMDPAGSVREGDTDLANSSSSYVQQALQYVARINEGKGLPPDVRKGLIAEIRKAAHVADLGYMQARTDYGELAKQGGLPEQVVIGQHDGKKYQDIEARYRQSIGQGAQKFASPQEFNGILSDMIEQGKPVAEIRKTLKEYGSELPAYQEKILDQYEQARLGGHSAQISVQTLPGGDTAAGLAVGAKKALDRAAIGAQGIYNSIAPQGMQSNSASEAAAPGLSYADPGAETVGRLAGSALLSAPIRAPMLAGAIGNLLMTDSTAPGDVAKDAIVGGIGGKVGDMAVRGVAGMVAPTGRDAMMRLNQQGVRFSPGQMIGGRARGLEDRLTANPVLGPQIGAIREQGLEAANRIPANRALGAIGQSLPGNVPAGHEAVGYTKNALGDFYDNALNGKSIGLDSTYLNRLNAIGQRSNLRPEEFNSAADIVQREVGGAFQEPNTPLGSMSGQTYKKLDSRLGRLGQDFGQSNNVFERDIGGLLMDVKDQTRALARRQNPGLGADLRAADEGYANYKILERAASSNPATGMFGAGQLRSAIRQSDRSVGKGATARGEARMQDLASDMSEAMPSTVGSSGTSEREQVNKVAPWVLGMLGSPLYSKPAQQVLERTLLRDPGITSRRVAKVLRSLPPGMFGGLLPYGVNSGSGY